MTNENDKSAERASENTNNNIKVTSDTKKTLANPNIIFNILMIVAVVLIIYLNINLYKKANNNTAQIQILTNLQNEIQAKNKVENAILANNLNIQIKTINNKLNSAIKDRWYQSNDWLMLKAKYYLELAVINSKWTNDIITSNGLLEEASYILRSIPGDGIIEVRKSIAKEQLSIKQIDKIDFVKILSNLNAIQKSINTLTPKSIINNQKKSHIESTDSPQTWKEHFLFAIKKLSKLVIIKHNENHDTEILTPAYLAMLLENIRLNLQQAELSVLEGNQEVFIIAIDKAIGNINRAFDTSSSKAKGIIDQLEDLKNLTVYQTKPVIGESLQLLSVIIESKDSNLGNKL